MGDGFALYLGRLERGTSRSRTRRSLRPWTSVTNCVSGVRKTEPSA